MQRRRSNRQPFKVTPWHTLNSEEQLLHVLLLIGALGALGYAVHKPIAERARRIQAGQPVAENRPGWVRFMELVQLIPPYSDLDRQPREPVRPQGPEGVELTPGANVAERPVPVGAPTENATRHPLGMVLTQAAGEATLPEVVVLDVDCGRDGSSFCIGWGTGTHSNSALLAMMGTPSFKAHRGPVSEWAVSAVHWPADRRGEPTFFALGIHTREHVEMHRTDFNQRSAELRARFVEALSRAPATAEDGATDATAGAEKGVIGDGAGDSL
jgi:hypothetical protein